MKISIIKTAIFINPFFAYSVFWIASLVLYYFSPSNLNIGLDMSLHVFLWFTIVISAILAIIFNNKFSGKEILLVYRNFSRKIVLGVIVLLAAMDFIYSGNIPLLSYLTGQNGNYLSFGMPTIHVIICTFLSFYFNYEFLMYRHFRKGIDLLSSIVSISFFILIFSRGMLLFLVVSSLCLIMCERRLTIRGIVILAFLAIIGSFAFGVFGNIRSGYAWNDTEVIIKYADIDADRYSLTSVFYWVDEYLVSPLRNLNHNIVHGNNEFSIYNYLSTIIPDFISKRIFTVDYSFELVSPAFTVASAYIFPYSYGGILGMYITFAIYAIAGFVYMQVDFDDTSLQLVILSMLFFIFGLSIFDNMLMYSGYSFAIVYPTIVAIHDHINATKYINVLGENVEPGATYVIYE